MLYTVKKKILIVSSYAAGTTEYCKVTNEFGTPTWGVTDIYTKPDDFRLVLFIGGADVSPEYYKEYSPKNMCKNIPHQDSTEKAIFGQALDHGIPMFGICRGLQFLNVMAGGRLLHHVAGHGGGKHNMFTYINAGPIEVNSLHHQSCIPAPSGYVIGWADKEIAYNTYIGNHDMPVQWEGPDVEAMIFPNLQCAGVQYHPEMMMITDDAFEWVQTLIEDLLIMGDKPLLQKYFYNEARMQMIKQMPVFA